MSTLKIQRGALRGRTIPLPAVVRGQLHLTPALVKEAAFQLLEVRLSSFEHYGFWDLTAGSGQMALEAWSLGFRPVTMCEVDSRRVRDLHQLTAERGLDLRIMQRDLRRMARPLSESPPAVVFVDLPYTFWRDANLPPLEQLLIDLDSKCSRSAKADGAGEAGAEQWRLLFLVQGPSPLDCESIARLLPVRKVSYHSYRSNHLTLFEFTTEKELSEDGVDKTR